MGVEITTEDNYQGRENDRVFLSLVNTKAAGFLSDIRRMNVALSRVREQIYIVGAIDFWREEGAAPALSKLAHISTRDKPVWSP